MIIMQILRQHENGVILDAIKTWEELTEEEIDKLPRYTKEERENQKNYKISRNKKNEVRRAVGHEFTDEYSAYLDERTSQPNIMDFSASLFGKGKQKKNADKKINKALKDKNINMTPEEASERALDL